MTRANRDLSKNNDQKATLSIQHETIAGEELKTNQSDSEEDSTNSDDQIKSQPTNRKEKKQLKKNSNGAKKTQKLILCT